MKLKNLIPQRFQTTLREKLIKIGAKVMHQARQVVFQMAEGAVSA